MEPDLYFLDTLQREEFAILAQQMLLSLIEQEQDSDQQSANCEMSGPGRSHFLPKNRNATTSYYLLSTQEKILSACKSAVKLHQEMYRIDPQTIQVSYRMYFAASKETLDLGSLWNGTIQFTGVKGDKINASIKVYSAYDIDRIICSH